MEFKSDIQIAQETVPQHITAISRKSGHRQQISGTVRQLQGKGRLQDIKGSC